MQLSRPLSPGRTICPNWKGMLERHGKTQLSQSHASFKIRAGRKPGCVRLFIVQDENLQIILIHLPLKLGAPRTFSFTFLLSRGHPKRRPSCQRGALQAGWPATLHGVIHRAGQVWHATSWSFSRVRARIQDWWSCLALSQSPSHKIKQWRTSATS